jgi:hypothetical protein
MSRDGFYSGRPASPSRNSPERIVKDDLFGECFANGFYQGSRSFVWNPNSEAGTDGALRRLHRRAVERDDTDGGKFAGTSSGKRSGEALVTAQRMMDYFVHCG